MFVRDELGGDALDFWHHGLLLKVARSDPKQVSASCAGWLVQYVKANEGVASLLKKDISFALRRGTIAQVTTALDAGQRAAEDELALNMAGWDR